MPSEHLPSSSGGETCSRPTSHGSRPLGEHPRQRRVVARHHVQAAGPAELPKLAEPAVGHHGHPAGHRDGELVVPGQPGERADRADPRDSARSARRPSGAGSAAACPHQTPSPAVRVLAEVDHAGTRWISVPVPSPPPQHIVTRPSSPSRRSSSATRVAISRAPVAPTGVAEGDRAAVDVHPVHVGLQFALPGQHHGGERLVDLEQVDVVDR